MARTIYKIPDSLDKNYGDTQIVLTTDKGLAMRPLPIKVIGGLIFGFLFALWLVASSFMSYSPMWLRGTIFCLIMLILYLLLWPDHSGESKYQMIPALIDYLPSSHRVVYVRRTQPVNNFMHVSGINQIYPKHGLIRFTDGSYGYAYRVVGNASVLLFNEDRDVVLDRVDNFYRKMKTDYTLIYLTAREPQHVDNQLERLRIRYGKLQRAGLADRDLMAIANMEYRLLNDEIGKHFRSIHQYLIIKAPNPEALTVGKTLLAAECTSQNMFKEADALFGKDLERMLDDIYKGRESI